MTASNGGWRVSIFATLSIFVFLQGQAALAQSRSFQMSLWVYETLEGEPYRAWIPTSADFDITMFSEGNPPQPAGLSILQLSSWSDEDFAEQFNKADKFDLSRIVAVVIDEPYLVKLGSAGFSQNSSNPCRDADEARREVVADVKRWIHQTAEALHAIAPKTRLWVNFSEPEVQWMMDAGCPLQLNSPDIDVVSVDKYDVSFALVCPYYEWFIQTSPQQQLALVPGTHFRVGGAPPTFTAQQAVTALQEYFNYANAKNANCNLSYGRLGITGNYDGCRVWVVAGWLAGSFSSGGVAYYGELHPNSEIIRNAWKNQLAVPQRAESSRFSNQAIQYLLRD